jgi:hypothetical protein
MRTSEFASRLNAPLHRPVHPTSQSNQLTSFQKPLHWLQGELADREGSLPPSRSRCIGEREVRGNGWHGNSLPLEDTVALVARGVG